MSTIPSKDRASLCLFTFADGRRCRIPRTSSHPHLCTYHARKESQSQAAQNVGRHLGTYFSGHYLSACDLTSALGHLFSAVAQGQIKSKTASTLAYLSQTLLQSIHLAQHEYINAFGANSWRQTIRDSFDRPSPSLPEAHLDAEYERNADTISAREPDAVAELPNNAASYLESTLAKLHQNK
jgi:hypothetical protein